MDKFYNYINNDGYKISDVAAYEGSYGATLTIVLEKALY